MRALELIVGVVGIGFVAAVWRDYVPHLLGLNSALLAPLELRTSTRGVPVVMDASTS